MDKYSNDTYAIILVLSMLGMDLCRRLPKRDGSL